MADSHTQGPGGEDSLRRLVNEMNLDRSAAGTNPAARTEVVVDGTAEALEDVPTQAVEDGCIKASLPGLLTALVELRSGEIHGKGLMEDLVRFFGADLSSGTVYPVLHELRADDGPLSVHELVQTKEYSIDDTEAAVAVLERAITQHIALGLVFRRALDGLEAVDEDERRSGP